MNAHNFVKLIRRNTKEHSPVILSTFAALGTITTAYLASRASFQAARLIDEDESSGGTHGDARERLMERTKLVWKLYIPAAISGTTTVVCIAGANRVGANKIIAAQSALGVTQQLYSDYRDKVIQEFGSRKDETIQAAVAEDRVKNNPPKDVLIAGPGNVLCCELYTGRYFSSDMESLRRAQNDINVKVLAHDYASLFDFYYEVGLGATTESSNLGWKSNKLMELKISAVLSDDGRPCLAFEYNYVTTL